MAKQRREKVNRDYSYQDIINRLGDEEDVSFERIGDTIIMRREESSSRKREEVGEEYEEPFPEIEKFNADMKDTEDKLVLVKREIEKKKFRRVSRKDTEELEAAFARLERRLDSLDGEFRSLRVELSYLRGVMLEKLQVAGSEELEKEYPKVEEIAVNKDGSQLQLVQDDIPEMKFEEKREKGSKLGFLTSTISNIYNSFFLGVSEEKDPYREFQKRLFLLVRTQPKSLDEIAVGSEESKANCLIWITRMVDEGLLEEMKEQGREGKRTYRIVWEKVS